MSYVRDDGRQVYGKVYPTPAESLRCVEVLTGLWEVGFRDGSPHRVPAVLEHLPQEQAVILAAASGRSLASVIHDGSAPRDVPRPASWEPGVAAAARWLAALHETPVEICRSTDVARPPKTRLLARRDTLVAARPGLTHETEDLLQVLADRAPRHTHAIDRTTHGRFHPEHVFLDPAGAVVTGIDLDRASPGDPARDLGEFVHRVRAMLGRSHRRVVHGPGESPGDQATALFLAEYQRSRTTAAELASLAYHWSFAILWHLFRSMVKDRSVTSLDRHRAEFEAVPQLVEQLSP